MDVFRRIGTQKKKFKVQFFIGRLKFSSYLPGKIYIVVRRGSHKAKSEQKLEMSSDMKLNFNKEILEIEVTLYFDQKENKYQEKPGEMSIVLLDQKNNKLSLGTVVFDVAEYANSGQESIKEKKKIEQMPKNLEGLIQYNVFAKYIGEGSQSSLDKIADFFFGKSKDVEAESKKESPSKLTKAKSGRKQTQQVKHSGSDGQNPGHEKDLTKTEVKRDKNSFDGSYSHYRKNYVTGVKSKKLNAYQTQQNEDDLCKDFYLDEAETDNRRKRVNSSDREKQAQKSKTKADFDEENPGEITKENRKSNQPIKTPSEQQNKPSSKSQKKIGNQNQDSLMTVSRLTAAMLALEKQLQNKVQQNQSLNSRLLQYEIRIRDLEKQVSKCQREKGDLEQEIQHYQDRIRQKQEEMLKQRNTVQNICNSNASSENDKIQFYEQQIKRLQKERTEYLVENSRLKEKYRLDFKKYEETLNLKNSKSAQLNDNGKLEIQRIKEECSAYRETIQKLTKEKNEKTAECSRQKNENRNLQEEMAAVKATLSKIKIKICNRLNEALMNNEDSTINILTEINKQD